MPTRIDIVLRVIDHIGISVQILRIVRLLDVRIRRDKPAKLVVVVPAAIIINTGLGIELLSGESIVGIDVAVGARDAAPDPILV